MSQHTSHACARLVALVYTRVCTRGALAFLPIMERLTRMSGVQAHLCHLARLAFLAWFGRSPAGSRVQVGVWHAWWTAGSAGQLTRLTHVGLKK